MRQLSVIVFIALVAGSMAAQNCSMLAQPAVNFYQVPSACKNNTAVKDCDMKYSTCINATAAGQCPSACGLAFLRCIEAAASTLTTCDSTFAGAFNNEKLYLAAGGDYNGSALMQSCNVVICGWMATDGKSCAMGTEMTLCADPMLNTPTPATPEPTPVPPGTTAAPGAATATFKFNGGAQEWTNVLSGLGGDRQALIDQVIVPILRFILNSFNFVVSSFTIGSLEVKFYMTDGTSTADVQNKLSSADLSGNNLPPEVQAALTVVKDNGGPATVSVDTTSITVETEAPAPPPGASASAVAVLAAIMAVAAMLF